MTKFNAACVLGAVLCAFPAAAQEKSYQGPSITVITGIDDTSNGRGRAGLLYGGQIGYDIQNGNVVFGIEGEVTGATTGKCYTYNYTVPVSTVRDCLHAGRDLYAGGKVGVVLGEATLLYGKAGYTNARFQADYSYTGAPPYAFKGDVTLDGLRVGAGIERVIGANLRLIAEYRYSNYEGNFSRHQGVVGLGFRF